MYCIPEELIGQSLAVCDFIRQLVIYDRGGRAASLLGRVCVWGGGGGEALDVCKQTNKQTNKQQMNTLFSSDSFSASSVTASSSTTNYPC